MALAYFDSRTGARVVATNVRTERAIEVEDLWRRYAETGDVELRNELIVQFQPLVKYVVARMAVKLPPAVDFDDLVSFGTVGLIEAVERFDATRSVSFQSFAILRIRGAVLDGLRHIDHLPRSVRQRARLASNEAARLTATLGREPSTEEVGAALGLSPEDYRRHLVYSSRMPVSLDALAGGDRDSEDASGEIGIADPDEPAVDDALEHEELNAELARATRKLPERLQLVLSLYYKEGLTLREVAQVLGVSESRVSQLQSKALARLRETLAARYPLAA